MGGGATSPNENGVDARNDKKTKEMPKGRMTKASKTKLERIRLWPLVRHKHNKKGGKADNRYREDKGSNKREYGPKVAGMCTNGVEIHTLEDAVNAASTKPCHTVTMSHAANCTLVQGELAQLFAWIQDKRLGLPRNVGSLPSLYNPAQHH